MAYHALSLRGFPSDMPSPQLLRIFNEGHQIEAQVVAMLKASGHEVEEVDPATGEQWEYTSHGDHHCSHLDGFIRLIGSTEWMTLEIKSMNRKLFDSFRKKGIALSHPHYYDQMQDGMKLAHLNGSAVSKSLMVAYCKDNSQYHMEIVDYDSERADELLMRADAAIAKGASMREGKSKYEYKCRECFKRTACWGGASIETPECSHCALGEPVINQPGKKWVCSRDGQIHATVCPWFKPFKPEEKV